MNLPSIEITVIGHYNHDNEKTAEFEEFLNNFPKWAHITPWMCLYNSFVY